MLLKIRTSEGQKPSIEEELVSKEPISVPKPSRRKIYVGITVALIIGLAVGYTIGSIPISGYKNQITILQNQLQNQQQQYNALNTNFQNLQEDYEDLHESYNTINTNYANLVAEYQGALKVPYTTIQEGDVVWAFKTLSETIQKWSMPLDTYTYYLEKSKPMEYHYLTTDGQTFTVRNMELFVQPEFFSNVIHDLTDGNTARDFVQEVFNLRVQLTLYSSDITDTPQWSAETMTKGTGDCEDFAILMGSLLTSGNQYAHYGMAVQMVYMDSNNPTNPQTVNHVMLYIKHQDGTTQLVDSTSTSVLSPWSRVVGWYYDIT
jgi:archaellin